MDKVTLYVEKSEPYCLFLDFVDMKEFLVFESLCPVKPINGNENNSMLCISNISMALKRRMREASTFQVDVKELAKLNWSPSEWTDVRYELDGRECTFEAMLPVRKRG